MADLPRLRIGNQTAFAARNLMAPFDYAVESAFDAFEWFPDKKPWGAGWDENDLNPGMRSHIRETARTREMRLSVHARWQANPLDYAAWPFLLKDLELAKDLGAVLLNIHLYTEQGIDVYVRAIEPLLKLATQLAVQVAIENTPVTGPEEFNEVFAKLSGLVPSGCAGMCLDVGHANLYGWTRHNYLRYLDQLSPDVPIIHLHLHENFGDYDSHLPLFTGPAGKDGSGVVGLLQRLQQRNFAGSVILEQWPEPPWLLRQARDKFLECASIARNSHTSNSSPGLS
jgi:sugar phosphate isomerase/epimerase